MTRTADVLVIGGGIAGCSAALQLARRRQRVIVVEKNSVGRHASGVNAGGVRRLLRDPAEIPLSVAAMQMWRGIAALVGDDCGFRVSGQVAVAETEAELTQLAERAALVRSLGYGHEELLDRDALFAVLPALSRHCTGGLIARGDGFASPYHTTLAFARAAVAAGAVVLEGCRAGRLARCGRMWRAKTSAGPIEAPIVLNCAGAWAGAVAAQAGEHPPLQPVAPMMMVSARMAAFVAPVVIGVGRKLSFKQAGNGSVLIGGGHRGVPDTAGDTSSVDFRKLATSARTVCDLFPIMRDARIVRAWSGIESRLPDDLPVIGPSATEPGLFHAFGFAGHGFQLGPIVGTILAGLATEGAINLPIAPFSITRFARATQHDGAA